MQSPPLPFLDADVSTQCPLPYLLSWAAWCSKKPLLPMSWQANTHTLFPHVARSRKRGDFTLIYYLTAALTAAMRRLHPSLMLQAFCMKPCTSEKTFFMNLERFHWYFSSLAWSLYHEASSYSKCHLSLKNVMRFLMLIVCCLQCALQMSCRCQQAAGISTRFDSDLFMLPLLVLVLCCRILQTHHFPGSSSMM